MLAFILGTVILTSSPDTPTEIIGSAATPDGGRNEIFIEQPSGMQDPFGQPDIQTPPPTVSPSVQNTSSPSASPTAITDNKGPRPLISQSSSVNPTDMNPLDYQNKIENTIYQDGNRLIDVQSIPLKDISSAVQPNLQPTITDYPAF